MNKYLIVVFLILICFFTLRAQGIKEETERLIKSSFPGEVSFEPEKFLLTPEIKKTIEKQAGQKFFGDYVYLYEISSGDSLVAYGILDNVYGKSMPITFLVIFDMDANIITSAIVKYREQYGGGVKNEKWNSQFKGMNSKSDFTVGRKIDAISGATISVNSVTKGIRKLTLLMNYILKNK